MKQNYNEGLFRTSIRKKLFFVSLLLGAVSINAQVTNFPWTETFEDNSPTRASWSQIYEVNNMSWTFASSPSTGGTGITPYEGAKFANYPGTSHLFDKTKLVSPLLDLSSIANPTVSFYFRNPYWNPDQNWLRIFYRVSEVSPWVQIAEFHSNVTVWTSSGAIILPTPSATYQIAVECETDYGYATTVDALVVTGTLGVNQFVKSSISFYPNPAENILNFSSNEIISEINVFNILGQKVLESKVNATTGQIDISNLTSGSYIVRGTTNLGTEMVKIIKT
ncbi:T9SS type A sorting domain-containing protein [Flavobacterium sp.]